MVRIALIGYGYWGPNIARTIAKIPGAQLHTICDVSLNSLRRAKEAYPHTTTTKSIASVAKNKKIDAVIIASPAKTHYAIAAQMLSNNKHILVEKPLTTNIEDADNLVKKHKKTSVIAMVGHTFEYNHAIRKIKNIIRKKTFGRVLYLYLTRVNLGQIRGDINAMWNLAPHDISTLSYLLEMKPLRVRAVGGSFLKSGVEDVAFISLSYPNKVLAEVHVSWLDPLKERKMTIVGTKKMLTFDDLDNEMPIRVYDKRADTGEVARGLDVEHKIKLHSGSIRIPYVPYHEPLLEELKHFVYCIRKNREPQTGLLNGRNVVTILASCQKSLQKDNGWVKVS